MQRRHVGALLHVGGRVVAGVVERHAANPGALAAAYAGLIADERAVRDELSRVSAAEQAAAREARRGAWRARQVAC